MGFSPMAVVQQVHNRQVTHITRSNNTNSIKHNTQNTTIKDTLPQWIQSKYDSKYRDNTTTTTNTTKKLNMLFNNPKVIDA
jgi:hypothetical protein